LNKLEEFGKSEAFLQIGALRRDLEKLANSAIDVWNSAQSGESTITVNQWLDRKHREEWRSQQFDPAPPSLDRSEADFDAISRTRPRIIALSPRVVAWEVADLVKDEKSPPGSFPPESDQAPHTIETCIHPGRGLPEWSSLVVRGKAEREEQKDFLVKAMENAKKESELWARHRPKEMKVPIQLSAMRHEYIYLALMHDASAGLLVLLQLSRAGWFATIYP
jgi:hypothetical protein